MLRPCLAAVSGINCYPSLGKDRVLPVAASRSLPSVPPRRDARQEALVRAYMAREQARIAAPVVDTLGQAHARAG